MTWVCLILILVAFGISMPGTWVARGLGRRWNALDSAGSPGHEKALRNVPNTGGMAIFAAVALPLALGLVAVWALPASVFEGLPGGAGLEAHLPGIRSRTPLAVLFLGCLTVLHVVGAVDDRRALPPGRKALVMVAAAAAIAVFGDGTRLVTMVDPYVGGAWLSVAITVVWIVAVTNAMNFIDNMDGLSAGVGAIAAGCFLAAALLHGQWFVAACLALLIGALLGFLVFNFPKRGGASVFMGDGGSLVLGFTLAFLTVRTTYYVEPGMMTDEGRAIPAGGWYGVFMPLVILAVPIYDIVSVTLIRLALKRSPFVASPHHLSHRLVSYGLTKRDAVVVIWGLTAVTGLSGVMLGSLAAWQAILVAAQLAALFGTVAVFETRMSGTRR